MSTKPKIEVFVISLNEATERQKIVAEFLSRLDLPWSFFFVSRYNKEQTPLDVHIDPSAALTNGEIGCFLSHRSLWQKIAETDLDYAIILEDDTILNPALDYYNLFGKFKELDLGFVYLFTLHLLKAADLAYLGDDLGHLIRVIKPRLGLGLAAYALNPVTANNLFTASKNINMPVDLWVEQYKNHNQYISCHFPSIATQIRTPSTIGDHSPEPIAQSIFTYFYRKTFELAEEFIAHWRLSQVDYQVRSRADEIKPGMGAWPRSKLRKFFRKYFS